MGKTYRTKSGEILTDTDIEALALAEVTADYDPEQLTVIEKFPTHCPMGHELGPNRMIVGWRPCNCYGGVPPGHRTVSCTECPGTWLQPPCRASQ